MVWFKVDDGFYTSSKVLSIPRTQRLAAVGLWTMAGTWSARALTDGIVPGYVLDELGATPRLIRALVDARLWIDRGVLDAPSTVGQASADRRSSLGRTERAVEFKDWVEYQPPRERVEAEREAARERQAKSRERRRGGQSGHGDVTRDSHRDSRVTHASVTDVSQRPDPTRPDPTHESAPHSPSQPSAADISRAFDEAYMAWPKKVERKQAQERFKVAARKRGVEQLLDDVKRFGAAYAATTDTKFVPALGVWLRGERWTDDLPTSDGQKSTPARASVPVSEEWLHR